MNKKTKKMLDEKMQVKLPDSLSTENIISNIESSTAEVVEIPRKKVNPKKIISMVASFAIIIGLVGTYFGLGLGEKNTPTTADNGDICEVVRYQSYDRLYEKIDELHKDYKKNVYLYNINGFLTGHAMDDGADMALPESSAGSSVEENRVETYTNSSTSNKDYGTTNNQENGVEEGDIIKTDGNYLYIVNGSRKSVSIVDVRTEKMTESAQIDLEENETIREIYLSGDKLVVIGSGYGLEETTSTNKRLVEDVAYPMYSNMDSFVRVYDVKDRKAPKLLNEYAQQGDYNSSRMIDGKLYNISSMYVSLDGDDYRDNCIPEINVNGTYKKIPADCIEIVEETKCPIYTVITTLDMSKDEEPSVEAVLGGSGEIYASEKGLFVSEQGNNETKIYRFAYTDTGVHYKCMGKVNGYLHNQFSMSFDGEYFRVATLSYKDETEKDGENVSSSSYSVTNLYILNDQMQTVGKVEDLAKGEQIKSVRFVGDMAYVVTFLQIDPLFVIDLSNSENPTVKGELKIPGFSEYLHPIADGLLVGVGSNQGDNYRPNDAKVSLFDVTNPYEPKEKSVLYVDGENKAYCYTQIGYNHKLYINLSETEFAVPFSVGKYVKTDTTGIKGGNYYIRYQLSGGELCEVARYYVGQNNDILGATYVENTFYVLKQDFKNDDANDIWSTHIVAFDMTTNKEVGTLKTDEVKYGGYYEK